MIRNISSKPLLFEAFLQIENLLSGENKTKIELRGRI